MVWLLSQRRLFGYSGCLRTFGVSVSMLTRPLSDSKWAINIARDPIKHELIKHIGVDVHFTRLQVQDGVVTL
jgi:hypothetical protein